MIAMSKDFKLISESYYKNPGVCLNFEKKILIFRDTLTIEKKYKYFILSSLILQANIDFYSKLLIF